MTEEQVERRQQILQAALSEFATKGFRGATIKSIATAANLQSPALIYWYFADKEALLKAVIEENTRFLQIAADPQAIMGLAPETVLPLFARNYLKMIDSEQKRHVGMILITEVVKQSPIGMDLLDTFMPRVLGFLKAYFDHQISIGYFRPHDTRSSIKMFMGMLAIQVSGKILLPALKADQLDDETHLQTAIDIFLRGIKKEPNDD